MAVPDFVSPDAALEQYRTPAKVATDLLWEAHQEDEIRGRSVVDLGCGTGVFAVGATILGADPVVGIDVDPGALGIARHQGVHTIESDVADVDLDLVGHPVDTVLMNPPFGAQNKGADRPFYEAAARLLDGRGAAWFLALSKTEKFLGHQAARLGADLERIMDWPYPIEARFAFHRDEVRTFEVAGYRMGW